MIIHRNSEIINLTVTKTGMTGPPGAASDGGGSFATITGDPTDNEALAEALAEAGTDLTSGPVTSSGGVSAIDDAALSIAKTNGLQTALDGVAETNGKTATLARFTQLTAGAFVASGDSPEIGGVYRIASQNTEPRMTVQTGGGIAGSGTLADGNGQLYYFGNDPGKTCRSYVFEVEYKPITSGTGIASGVITFSFHSSPVLPDTYLGLLPLPAGMLHIQTSEGGIGDLHFGYAHAQGANFTAIPAVGETASGGIYLWNPANPTGSLPRNKKFTIEFQFEGEECRVICMGRTMVFRSPHIAAAAPRYWFFESCGAASNSNAAFPVLHSVAIDSDKWQANAEQSQTLREFVMGSPLERPIVQGGSAATSSLTLKATSSGSAASGASIALFGGSTTRVFTGAYNGFMSLGDTAPINTIAAWPRIQLLGSQTQGSVMVTNSFTQSANKDASINFGHYTGQTSGLVAGIRVTSTSGETITSYGGSNASIPATMRHSFYTGATTTTYGGGTERMRISSDGAVEVFGALTAASFPSANLTGDIAAARIASALAGGTLPVSATTIAASGIIAAPTIKAASGGLSIVTNATGPSGAGSVRFGGVAINTLESWGGTAGGALYIYSEGALRMLIGGSSGMVFYQNAYPDSTGLTLGLSGKRWGTMFGTAIDASGTLAVTGISSLTGGMQLGTKTVGTLPTASANPYLEFVVTDSLAPVVGSTVASGGSAKCKVISNGTAWLVSTVL